MNNERPVSRQPIPRHAKIVYQGKLFSVCQWEQEQYDGTKASFEKIRRPDTAYILPATSDGKVLIVRQEQPGMEPYYGLIGGRVESGETAIEAAVRELSEEVGATSSRLELWESFQFLPKIDWAIYVFVAPEFSSTPFPSPDPGERIALCVMSLEELFALAATDAFGDVEIALLLLRTAASAQRTERLRKLLFRT